MKLKLQSLKIMLLGMMFIMVGATMVVDPNFKLGGLEYVLLVAGLFLGIIGFWRED
jgi:hypothetical protein